MQNSSIYNFFSIKKKESSQQDNSQNLQNNTQQTNQESSYNDNDEFDSEESFNPQRKNKLSNCFSVKQNQLQKQTPSFQTKKISKSNKKIIQEKEVKNQSQNNGSLQNFNSKENGLIDQTPFWAKPENLLDSQQRKPNDPNYDPTTLYIPKDGLKGQTPARIQYWKIKSENFDKIILVKLGKFYELFEEDAVNAVKYLDLNFMGNKKRAGFPEQSLDKYLKLLTECNFKVAIVEQVETVKELERRIKNKDYKADTKILKRDIVFCSTKSTFSNFNNLEDDFVFKNFIWVFTENKNQIFITLMNFQTNTIFYEIFDTLNFYYLNSLKIYLNKYPPAEIIIKSNSISSGLKLLLQNLPNNPIFLEQQKHKFNWEELLQKINFIDQDFFKNLNEVIQDIDIDVLQPLKDNILQLFYYLDDLLLFDKGVIGCKINPLQQLENEKDNMLLDSQALEHLEIFYNSKGEQQNTLFSIIDKCVTNFGKRKLKKILEEPLYNREKIIQRQRALQDLENNKFFRDQFQKQISKLKDLEKLYHFLSKYKLKQKKKVIFFSDVSTKKINEMFIFFENIEIGLKSLNIFKNQSQIQSELLQELLNNIPQIQDYIQEIKSKIIWKDNVAFPEKNFDKEFDNCQQNLQQIDEQLEEYLYEMQQNLKCQDISFVRGKYRVELKVPQKISKQLSYEEFQFSSKSGNYEKFISTFLKTKIEQMENIEELQKERLYLFVSHIFELFTKFQNEWLQFIDIISNLDVLCSLSVYSFDDFLNLTCPIINENSNLIKVQNLKHPVLIQLQQNFIGNDIEMKDQRLFILTGPNMGGKSTIMRTLAINIILAQIGCYVNADYFEFSLVDRIFTRIGASDRLEQHKSTFYIEMEEMKTILDHGTQNSLAIIDELGRGTSTYDGYSIAVGCLKILNELKCKVFFATHYFFIIDDIQDFEKNISYKQMDYVLVNEKNEQILFLYKIKDGICEKSFAFNVAQMAGIPDTIIKRAQQITNKYRLNDHIQLIQKKFVFYINKNF